MSRDVGPEDESGLEKELDKDDDWEEEEQQEWEDWVEDQENKRPQEEKDDD